jgi:hypothetical protein
VESVSLRMTAYLNSMLAHRVSAEVAAAAVVGTDVAHHVVNPDAVLGGLDPTRATALEDAIEVLGSVERERWVLALPLPGVPGSVRGPRRLTEAAVEVGEAVLAATGGVAVVPYRVGRAVQWRVFEANRPQSPPTPYDAERSLSEAVLGAARTLAQLDVAGGTRPKTPTVELAPGYSARQHATAQRAGRLLAACNAALADDGGSISSFEVETRARELRTVRDACVGALCAAASWIDVR